MKAARFGITGNSVSQRLKGAWALTLGFLAFVAPMSAHAQSATQGFGGLLCSGFTNMGAFPGLFTAIAYIGGLSLIASGLAKFRAYAENAHQNPIHQPVLRVGAGSALMTAPTVFGWVVQTLGYKASTGGGGAACAPGATNAGALPLDELVRNFVNNINDPITFGMQALGYALGGYLVIRGLIKASKYGTDPRAYSVSAITANLAVGGVLLVFAQSVGMMMGTIFGENDIKKFTAINWEALGVTGDMTRVNAATTAAITFIQLIGIIAFMRGWWIVKHSVEGVGQATMGQGLTHIVGGALAMNIKTTLDAAEKTFGVNFVV